MASGSYMQVHVTCPFYLSDNGKDTIMCEGIVPGSTDHCVFDNKADYKTQICIFCAQHNDRCERYRRLMQQYDEGRE